MHTHVYLATIGPRALGWSWKLSELVERAQVWVEPGRNVVVWKCRPDRLARVVQVLTIADVRWGIVHEEGIPHAR